MTSSKQNVGDKKIDFRRRSQAEILSEQRPHKIAWWWSFPTPSFCIVQNINRRCLPFQNLRFWKIATSEKISRATFKKISRLEIYELLFLWSHVLPIKKFFMTACVLCFKIFCDGLFSLNGFVNSLVSSSSKISIPLVEVSGGFSFLLSVTVLAISIFQKSSSAKFFTALGKNFLEFDLSMNGFFKNYFFTGERKS